MFSPLPRKFYLQPTLHVARELIGKFLVRVINDRQTMIGRITETESYSGFRDKASHAYRGKTPRNSVMFEEAGHAYVYLVYGMHFCFNIVTGKISYPAAVLIRAVQILDPITLSPLGQLKTDGPGKLCKILQINKSLNNVDMAAGQQLFVSNTPRNFITHRKEKILRTPRIGIPYAEEYKEKKWRFVLR